MGKKSMKNAMLCIPAYFILTCFSLRTMELGYSPWETYEMAHPLRYAVYCGNVQVVKEHIKSQDINERDAEQETPLYAALSALRTKVHLIA